MARRHRLQILASLLTWCVLPSTIVTAAGPDYSDSSPTSQGYPDDAPPAAAYRSGNSQGRQSRYRSRSSNASTASMQSAPVAQVDEVVSPSGPVANGRQVAPFPEDSPYGADSIYQPLDSAACGNNGCCQDCGGYGPSCTGPIYVRGEYLSWWLKGESLPPLVTTSPAGTAQAAAGVLGQTGTSILFGGDAVNGAMRSGGRVVLGWWLDPSTRIEGEFFGLGQAQTGFDQTSNGNTILARPFFNLSTGAADSHLIAYPAQLEGSVHAQANSSFLGAGVHAMQNLTCANYCGDRQHRVDFLYGFRYLHLGENLAINDSLTTTGTGSGSPVGTTFATSDAFRTTNNFYGINLGMMTESRMRRWCFTTIGRLGLGATTEQIAISGSSTSTTPGGTPNTTSGGLLAFPTNIGTYNHTGFTVVPQLELKLGYDITQRLRVTVGYDLIYWSRVARPADQVSTNVNPTQSAGQPLTGTPGPVFALRETDLWVQGVSVGGEWRF